MSIRDIQMAPGKPLFTVHNMLVFMAALMSLTFGMFVWEAERAITKLDTISDKFAANDKRDEVQETRLASAEFNERTFTLSLADHEHRLTVLETIGVHSGQPNISYPAPH
jgi:hypothetical protein